MLLRGSACGHGFIGIFVRQLVETETDRFDDFGGTGGQRFVSGEETHHLGRALQVAFCVGIQLVAGALDGRMFANGSEDVLQRATFGKVVENVVGGDQRHFMTVSELGQLGDTGAVITPVEHVSRQIERSRETTA